MGFVYLGSDVVERGPIDLDRRDAFSALGGKLPVQLFVGPKLASSSRQLAWQAFSRR